MDFIFYYNRINLSKEIDSAKNNINNISKSETILLFENLALDHSVKPLSSLQLFFIPTTNGSPQLFLDPTPFPPPPTSWSIFLRSNHDKKYPAQQKRLFPCKPS